MSKQAAARLTTKDVVAAFGVTPMTVTNWRAGTPTRTKLPFTKRGRAVSYQPDKVRGWAEKNGVPIADEAALAGGTPRLKPGPKAAPREAEEAAP